MKTTVVTSPSTTTEARPLRPDEQRRIQEADFAWDLVLELSALREQRGLTQTELARLLDTKQQAVSRIEDPTYTGHSLRTLRDAARALGAYVDVVVVPEEKLPQYLEHRSQPVLDEESPSEANRVTGPTKEPPEEWTRARHIPPAPAQWRALASPQSDVQGRTGHSRLRRSVGSVEVPRPRPVEGSKTAAA